MSLILEILNLGYGRIFNKKYLISSSNSKERSDLRKKNLGVVHIQVTVETKKGVKDLRQYGN